MAFQFLSTVKTKGTIMQQFLLILQIINQIIPTIRATVEALNTAFPESGTGETKFQIVLHTVTAAINKIEGAEAVIGELVPIITPIIRATADGVKALKAA
jgi:hypothetical protein